LTCLGGRHPHPELALYFLPARISDAGLLISRPVLISQKTKFPTGSGKIEPVMVSLPKV
jgi:hypothetical protein